MGTQSRLSECVALTCREDCARACKALSVSMNTEDAQYDEESACKRASSKEYADR
jgi:hypothetical protein